jgi:thymidylate synthase (FAD)
LSESDRQNREEPEVHAAELAQTEADENGLKESAEERLSDLVEAQWEKRILDRGFIRLVGTLGGDEAVVQSARVSFGSGTKGEEKDRKLINYLIKHHHETPFEHAVFKFHVKCPMFVARQWFRHRWASYNEISGRYTTFDEGEMHLPTELRAPDAVNRQGSSGRLESDVEARLLSEMADHQKASWDLYNRLLEAGVAKEIAREVLPLALYTEFYWTVNARSLMNFIRLRAEEHAQLEIRYYALAFMEVFRLTMPWTFDAFREHIFRDLSTGLEEEGP